MHTCKEQSVVTTNSALKELEIASKDDGIKLVRDNALIRESELIKESAFIRVRSIGNSAFVKDSALYQKQCVC